FSNLCAGISFAGQAISLAQQMAATEDIAAIQTHFQTLDSHLASSMFQVNWQDPVSAALVPLIQRLEETQTALQRRNPDQIRTARDNLATLLQGGLEWTGVEEGVKNRPLSPLMDPVYARARVRRIFLQNSASSYRAASLHRSDGGVLPILEGISHVRSLGRCRGPKVLFVSLFPLGSNGSGTYTKAMAQHIINRGGEASVIFLGHQLEKDMGRVSQYLVPFTPQQGEPLEGAATGYLPVFDSNPASPYGTRFRDMTPEELDTYTEAVADAVKVAVEDMKPDALIVNHAFVGAEAARRTGLPFVVVCHGTCSTNMGQALQPENTYPKNFVPIVRKGVQAAGHIVAITDDVGEEIRNFYGMAPESITTIPNGFHSDIFTPDAAFDRAEVLRRLGLDLPNVRRVVSFAGRMVHYKGVVTLLKAAKSLKAKIPGLHFILAGHGKKMEEYLQLVKAWDIGDVVHFVGQRSLHELADLYRISDVGAVPSWREPFGIVPLEIAGTGTPVIASNVGGLRQTVTPTVGRLVDAGHAPALAEALETALKENLKAQIGAQASAYVHATYPWEVGGERLLALLKETSERDGQQRRAGASG
ncbi:MAG: glycosyltransferase family 4 protein, partial [bacterium]|nr:glycosyltransferase family 4 protein [bacterium]